MSKFKMAYIDDWEDNECTKTIIKNYNSRLVKGKIKKRNTIWWIHGPDTSTGKNTLGYRLGEIDDVYEWDLYDNGYQSRWNSSKDYKIILINDVNDASAIDYKFLESIANNRPVSRTTIRKSLILSLILLILEHCL